MKKVIITVFVIVFLAAILSFAANDSFLQGVYDWIIGIIENIFNV